MNMLNKIRCSGSTDWSRARKIASSLFCTKINADKGEAFKLSTRLDFGSKYDRETTDRILNVFNENSQAELLRYNIPKKRALQIEKYRKSNGPFKTIEQVLEVDGFGVNILEKFASSIARGPSKVVLDVEPGVTQKFINDISSPVLTNEKKCTVNTITGINLSPKSVSWAKMGVDGRLLTWDTTSQFEWPRRDDTMKLHELALAVHDLIPESDIYVTELPPATQLTTVQQNVPGLFTEQRIQLAAMIATLIASKLNIPNGTDKPKWTARDNFYFVRRNLPARLFKLFIGKELVSTSAVIGQIMDSDLPKSLEHIPPIIIDSPQIEKYHRSDLLKKEALGQALLCCAAFTILAVQQNIPALKGLGGSGYKNYRKQN